MTSRSAKATFSAAALMTAAFLAFASSAQAEVRSPVAVDSLYGSGGISTFMVPTDLELCQMSSNCLTTTDYQSLWATSGPVPIISY